MAKEKKDADYESSWDVVDVLSQTLNLDHDAVSNTVKLLDSDNTVPFIARYRKEATKNMAVETIREVKENYEELLSVRTKAATVMKTLEKMDKLSKSLGSALKAAQDLKEIEYLYTPFKAGSKRSFAERARELGLEDLAQEILKGNNGVKLESAIQAGKEGLTFLKEVEKGVQHIIADIISKDKKTLDRIRDLCKYANITVDSCKSRATTKKEKDGDSKLDNNAQKFEIYFNFSCSVRNIKHHQVLAINRGEHLKILTVKINIPDRIKDKFLQYCQSLWSQASKGRHQKLFTTSVEDAYKRLLAPLMIRNFRSDMTKQAEKASVEVFSSNLKRLLLSPPVRGRVVLGLDPGFRNGCKFAVTSISGGVLQVGVFHMLNKYNKANKELNRLCDVVKRHGCETIAIGNGTACRETESVLSDLIKAKAFEPLDVKYCITSENGASIYSASDVAIQELPDLDVTMRGAVSIARRLQDPLAELVKIEPKHIGVGMYQHDIHENQLKSALDGVVEECVSFVGVDVNVGSEMLLRRVAGLGAARAKKIIEWRSNHGPFISRAQLRDIRGLGPKSYEQCAGFIRVLPETSRRDSAVKSEESEAAGTTEGKKRKAGKSGKEPASKRAKKSTPAETNMLDMTCIHPESYHLADQLIDLAKANRENLGQSSFIGKIKALSNTKGIGTLSEKLGAGEPTVQLIINGLSEPLGHDMRESFEKPLFKQGLTSMEDLKQGTTLTGRVSNTTHFGAFVDVGVGRDALLHTSRTPRHLLQGKAGLELGDKVEVTVDTIERQRGRIGLRLLRLL